MNTPWPKSEIEKVKPFAERAAQCAHDLDLIRRSFRTIFGDNEWLKTMLKAQELLLEAVTRGVRGKEKQDA